MSSNPILSVLQTAGRPKPRLAERADAVIALLHVLTDFVTVPDNRRRGSAFKILLPLMDLGCAATRGETVESLGRFALQQVRITGLKYLIDESWISQRPDGAGKGFQSGHTAVATFGAIQTINHCSALHPVTKAAAVAAAAFTGESRTEAGRHFLWPTMAMALWGGPSACLPVAGLKGTGRWVRKVRGRHV